MLKNISNKLVTLKNRKNSISGIKGKNYQGSHMNMGGWWISLFLLSFFSGLFLPSTCPASGEEGYKMTRRDKAFGIHFIDEKCGWLVGDKGLTLKTMDGGENWHPVKISHDTLNDIFFFEETGWIVGVGGLILHTENGGKSWNKQRGSDSPLPVKGELLVDGSCPAISPLLKSLMKVSFLNREKGFSVGADGTILRTADGGASWEDVSLDCMEIMPEELIMNGIFSINLYSVLYINENSGWIVGDSGAILHSEDGGKEWIVKNLGLLPPLFAISFKNDKEGWAVGQNGFSLKTNDGGKTWGKVVLEKENSLYGIRVYDNYGVIVGDQATIIMTNDGGKTWGKVKTDLYPPYPWLADAWIFPSNSAKVLSVGKGVILRTSVDSR